MDILNIQIKHSSSESMGVPPPDPLRQKGLFLSEGVRGGGGGQTLFFQEKIMTKIFYHMFLLLKISAIKHVVNF